jgi:hypothetical protein
MLARKFPPPNTETSTPHCLLPTGFPVLSQPIIFRSSFLGNKEIQTTLMKS